MNHQTSDTPETDRTCGWGIGELIATARGIERERDEARAQLHEEQRLHVQTLDELDEARKLFQSSKRARASLSEACDHLQGIVDKMERERDEALKSAEHAKAYKRVIKAENQKLRRQIGAEGGLLALLRAACCPCRPCGRDRRG